MKVKRLSYIGNTLIKIIYKILKIITCSKVTHLVYKLERISLPLKNVFLAYFCFIIFTMESLPETCLPWVG